MKGLINIIHHYTYKVIEKTLIMGPIEQFKERDEKISRFVNTGIDNGIKILVHWNKPSIHPSRLFEYVSFSIDEHYSFLFNPSIENITTYPNGLPLVDKKPESISKEKWSILTQIYIQHSSLSEKIGNPEKIFIIGGQIECCLANFISYLDIHYPNLRNNINYIPELCVSNNKKLASERERDFRKLGISFLSFEEAINMIN